MPIASRTERIPSHDSGDFSGHLVLPESGRGPGLVVAQEIFGLTKYVKEVCERLARLGYVALAPDLYWRLEPGVALEEEREGSLEQAFGYRQRVDYELAVEDAIAAVERLRALPETGGRAGILGFCFGGGIAFRVAAQDQPDVAVSYYGSEVPASIGMRQDVRCPILFHFGAEDQYFTPDKQKVVMEAFAREPRAEFHVHEGAGHAFDNWNSAMFHHERAAEEAWAQTEDWLRRNYPAG